MISKSKYQIWLTFNGEKQKIRFSVLPEIINISYGSKNKSVDISELGEIVIKQGRPAIVIDFKSFFPAVTFPGIQVKNITPPETLKNKIVEWQNSDKPVHFIITGTEINMFCVIEDFSCSEQGGDVGTIHFLIKLKEYREVKARQVKVDIATKIAVLPASITTSVASSRVDNRVIGKIHIVNKGECLYDIALKYLGDGSRYTEIYNLNNDKIKNPALLEAGVVLKLPDK